VRFRSPAILEWEITLEDGHIPVATLVGLWGISDIPPQIDPTPESASSSSVAHVVEAAPRKKRKYTKRKGSWKTTRVSKAVSVTKYVREKPKRPREPPVVQRIRPARFPGDKPGVEKVPVPKTELEPQDTVEGKYGGIQAWIRRQPKYEHSTESVLKVFPSVEKHRLEVALSSFRKHVAVQQGGSWTRSKEGVWTWSS